MDEDTFTALSQRSSAFWIGVGLLVVGSLLPESVRLGDRWLGSVLIGVGAAILAVRLLVGLYRLSRSWIGAGRIGYSEGKNDTE